MMKVHNNKTEDTSTLWGEKRKFPIKLKGRGLSILASEFIEKDGYLALSEEQYKFEVAKDENMNKLACAILEFSEKCEGYCEQSMFYEADRKSSEDSRSVISIITRLPSYLVFRL